MEWEPPAYTDINMSSEIGGYQEDFDERLPVPGEGAPTMMAAEDRSQNACR
jgi:hypothetical protein